MGVLTTCNIIGLLGTSFIIYDSRDPENAQKSDALLQTQEPKQLFHLFLPISSYWFHLDLMQICHSKRYWHGYILLTFSLSAWNLRRRWMQICKVIGLPVQNEHVILQDHISFTFFKVSFNLSRLPATTKNLVSFWTGWLSGDLEWILQNRLL